MARSMQHYTQHTTCNRHRAMHSCNAPCCTVRATDHVKRRVECCMFCARAACSGAHVACAGRATCCTTVVRRAPPQMCATKFSSVTLTIFFSLIKSRTLSCGFWHTFLPQGESNQPWT